MILVAWCFVAIKPNATIRLTHELFIENELRLDETTPKGVVCVNVRLILSTFESFGFVAHYVIF